MMRTVLHFALQQFQSGRAVRVLVVGGIGFVGQTILFETLAFWLALVTPSTATLIGAEYAILSNFFLNERFSFGDIVDRSRSRTLRIARFHLVSAGSLAVQWLSVFTVEHMTSSPVFINLGFIFGVGVGFILNYTGYYFFVWRQK